MGIHLHLRIFTLQTRKKKMKKVVLLVQSICVWVFSHHILFGYTPHFINLPLKHVLLLCAFKKLKLSSMFSLGCCNVDQFFTHRTHYWELFDIQQFNKRLTRLHFWKCYEWVQKLRRYIVMHLTAIILLCLSQGEIVSLGLFQTKAKQSWNEHIN